MKIHYPALVAAFFSAQPQAFAFTSSTAFSQIRTAVDNKNGYETFLLGNMDAYDEQMRAMSAGATTAPLATNTPAGTDKMSQRFRKKTKQLATLGPASCDFEMIEKLFLAGADVFRLNFSHFLHRLFRSLKIHENAIQKKSL